MGQSPRRGVIVVADNASLGMGGEAAIAHHVFRVLSADPTVEATLLVHERNRAELEADFPDLVDHIRYATETRAHRLLWKCADIVPARLGEFLFGMPARILVQRRMRATIRELVSAGGVDLVHQPTPVATREPSAIHDVGVPVVIGPLNGNVTPPPAFASFQGRAVDLALATGRRATGLLNAIVPGKRRAATVLVANPRTAAGLPAGLEGDVVELVENGVDLRIWSPLAEGEPVDESTFVFVGRLVAFKAVDIVIEAVAKACETRPVSLEIIGDGEERAALEWMVDQLDLRDRVRFLGWMRQGEIARRLGSATAMVMPSLAEPGGAVVLEAMACGRPVISTNWGGMATYLDDSCAVLVDPTSRPALVGGFAAAMVALADDPAEASRLGAAGRVRCERDYDWDAKAQRLIEIYDDVIARHAGVPGAAGTVDGRG